jgi:hypothetical protein
MELELELGTYLIATWHMFLATLHVEPRFIGNFGPIPNNIKEKNRIVLSCPAVVCFVTL